MESFRRYLIYCTLLGLFNYSVLSESDVNSQEIGAQDSSGVKKVIPSKRCTFDGQNFTLSSPKYYANCRKIDGTFYELPLECSLRKYYNTVKNRCSHVTGGGHVVSRYNCPENATGLVKHSDSSHEYFICGKGAGVMATCLKKYNNKLKHCVNERGRYTVTKQDDSRGLIEVPDCKVEGTFAVPVYEAYYYRCIKGTSRVMYQFINKCEDNRIFNAASGKCVQANANTTILPAKCMDFYYCLNDNNIFYKCMLKHCTDISGSNKIMKQCTRDDYCKNDTTTLVDSKAYDIYDEEQPKPLQKEKRYYKDNQKTRDPNEENHFKSIMSMYTDMRDSKEKPNEPDDLETLFYQNLPGNLKSKLSTDLSDITDENGIKKELEFFDQNIDLAKIFHSYNKNDDTSKIRSPETPKMHFDDIDKYIPDDIRNQDDDESYQIKTGTERSYYPYIGVNLGNGPIYGHMDIEHEMRHLGKEQEFRNMKKEVDNKHISKEEQLTTNEEKEKDTSNKEKEKEIKYLEKERDSGHKEEEPDTKKEQEIRHVEKEPDTEQREKELDIRNKEEEHETRHLEKEQNTRNEEKEKDTINKKEKESKYFGKEKDNKNKSQEQEPRNGEKELQKTKYIEEERTAKNAEEKNTKNLEKEQDDKNKEKEPDEKNEEKEHETKNVDIKQETRKNENEHEAKKADDEQKTRKMEEDETTNTKEHGAKEHESRDIKNKQESKKSESPIIDNPLEKNVPPETLEESDSRIPKSYFRIKEKILESHPDFITEQIAKSPVGNEKEFITTDFETTGKKLMAGIFGIEFGASNFGELEQAIGKEFFTSELEKDKTKVERELETEKPRVRITSGVFGLEFGGLGIGDDFAKRFGGDIEKSFAKQFESEIQKNESDPDKKEDQIVLPNDSNEVENIQNKVQELLLKLSKNQNNEDHTIPFEKSEEISSIPPTKYFRTKQHTENLNRPKKKPEKAYGYDLSNMKLSNFPQKAFGLDEVGPFDDARGNAKEYDGYPIRKQHMHLSDSSNEMTPQPISKHIHRGPNTYHSPYKHYRYAQEYDPQNFRPHKKYYTNLPPYYKNKDHSSYASGFYGENPQDFNRYPPGLYKQYHYGQPPRYGYYGYYGKRPIDTSRPKIGHKPYHNKPGSRPKISNRPGKRPKLHENRPKVESHRPKPKPGVNGYRPNYGHDHKNEPEVPKKVLNTETDSTTKTSIELPKSEEHIKKLDIPLGKFTMKEKSPQPAEETPLVKNPNIIEDEPEVPKKVLNTETDSTTKTSIELPKSEDHDKKLNVPLGKFTLKEKSPQPVEENPLVKNPKIIEDKNDSLNEIIKTTIGTTKIPITNDEITTVKQVRNEQSENITSTVLPQTQKNRKNLGEDPQAEMSKLSTMLEQRKLEAIVKDFEKKLASLKNMTKTNQTSENPPIEGNTGNVVEKPPNHKNEVDNDDPKRKVKGDETKKHSGDFNIVDMLSESLFEEKSGEEKLIPSVNSSAIYNKYIPVLNSFQHDLDAIKNMTRLAEENYESKESNLRKNDSKKIDDDENKKNDSKHNTSSEKIDPENLSYKQYRELLNKKRNKKYRDRKVGLDKNKKEDSQEDKEYFKKMNKYLQTAIITKDVSQIDPKELEADAKQFLQNRESMKEPLSEKGRSLGGRNVKNTSDQSKEINRRSTEEDGSISEEEHPFIKVSQETTELYERYDHEHPYGSEIRNFFEGLEPEKINDGIYPETHHKGIILDTLYSESKSKEIPDSKTTTTENNYDSKRSMEMDDLKFIFQGAKDADLEKIADELYSAKQSQEFGFDFEKFDTAKMIENLKPAKMAELFEMAEKVIALNETNTPVPLQETSNIIEDTLPTEPVTNKLNIFKYVTPQVTTEKLIIEYIKPNKDVTEVIIEDNKPNDLENYIRKVQLLIDPKNSSSPHKLLQKLYQKKLHGKKPKSDEYNKQLLPIIQKQSKYHTPTIRHPTSNKKIKTKNSIPHDYSKKPIDNGSEEDSPKFDSVETSQMLSNPHERLEEELRESNEEVKSSSQDTTREIDDKIKIIRLIELLKKLNHNLTSGEDKKNSEEKSLSKALKSSDESKSFYETDEGRDKSENDARELIDDVLDPIIGRRIENEDDSIHFEAEPTTKKKKSIGTDEIISDEISKSVDDAIDEKIKLAKLNELNHADCDTDEDVDENIDHYIKYFTDNNIRKDPIKRHKQTKMLQMIGYPGKFIERNELGNFRKQKPKEKVYDDDKLRVDTKKDMSGDDKKKNDDLKMSDEDVGGEDMNASDDMKINEGEKNGNLKKKVPDQKVLDDTDKLNDEKVTKTTESTLNKNDEKEKKLNRAKEIKTERMDMPEETKPEETKSKNKENNKSSRIAPEDLSSTDVKKLSRNAMTKIQDMISETEDMRKLQDVLRDINKVYKTNYKKLQLDDYNNYLETIKNLRQYLKDDKIMRNIKDPKVFDELTLHENGDLKDHVVHKEIDSHEEEKMILEDKKVQKGRKKNEDEPKHIINIMNKKRRNHNRRDYDTQKKSQEETNPDPLSDIQKETDGLNSELNQIKEQVRGEVDSSKMKELLDNLQKTTQEKLDKSQNYFYTELRSGNLTNDQKRQLAETFLKLKSDMNIILRQITLIKNKLKQKSKLEQQKDTKKKRKSSRQKNKNLRNFDPNSDDLFYDDYINNKENYDMNYPGSNLDYKPHQDRHKYSEDYIAKKHKPKQIKPNKNSDFPSRESKYGSNHRINKPYQDINPGLIQEINNTPGLNQGLDITAESNQEFDNNPESDLNPDLNQNYNNPLDDESDNPGLNKNINKKLKNTIQRLYPSLKPGIYIDPKSSGEIINLNKNPDYNHPSNENEGSNPGSIQNHELIGSWYPRSVESDESNNPKMLPNREVNTELETEFNQSNEIKNLDKNGEVLNQIPNEDDNKNIIIEENEKLMKPNSESETNFDIDLQPDDFKTYINPDFDKIGRGKSKPNSESEDAIKIYDEQNPGLNNSSRNYDNPVIDEIDDPKSQLTINRGSGIKEGSYGLDNSELIEIIDSDSNTTLDTVRDEKTELKNQGENNISKLGFATISSDLSKLELTTEHSVREEEEGRVTILEETDRSRADDPKGVGSETDNPDADKSKAVRSENDSQGGSEVKSPEIDLKDVNPGIDSSGSNQNITEEFESNKSRPNRAKQTSRPHKSRPGHKKHGSSSLGSKHHKQGSNHHKLGSNHHKSGSNHNKTRSHHHKSGSNKTRPKHKSQPDHNQPELNHNQSDHYKPNEEIEVTYIKKYYPYYKTYGYNPNSSRPDLHTFTEEYDINGPHKNSSNEVKLNRNQLRNIKDNTRTNQDENNQYISMVKNYQNSKHKPEPTSDESIDYSRNNNTNRHNKFENSNPRVVKNEQDDSDDNIKYFLPYLKMKSLDIDYDEANIDNHKLKRVDGSTNLHNKKYRRIKSMKSDDVDQDDYKNQNDRHDSRAGDMNQNYTPNEFAKLISDDYARYYNINDKDNIYGAQSYYNRYYKPNEDYNKFILDKKLGKFRNDEYDKEEFDDDELDKKSDESDVRLGSGKKNKLRVNKMSSLNQKFGDKDDDLFKKEILVDEAFGNKNNSKVKRNLNKKHRFGDQEPGEVENMGDDENYDEKSGEKEHIVEKHHGIEKIIHVVEEENIGEEEHIGEEDHGEKVGKKNHAEKPSSGEYSNEETNPGEKRVTVQKHTPDVEKNSDEKKYRQHWRNLGEKHHVTSSDEKRPSSERRGHRLRVRPRHRSEKEKTKLRKNEKQDSENDDEKIRTTENHNSDNDDMIRTKEKHNSDNDDNKSRTKEKHNSDDDENIRTNEKYNPDNDDKTNERHNSDNDKIRTNERNNVGKIRPNEGHDSDNDDYKIHSGEEQSNSESSYENGHPGKKTKPTNKNRNHSKHHLPDDDDEPTHIKHEPTFTIFRTGKETTKIYQHKPVHRILPVTPETTTEIIEETTKDESKEVETEPPIKHVIKNETLKLNSSINLQPNEVIKIKKTYRPDGLIEEKIIKMRVLKRTDGEEIPNNTVEKSIKIHNK